MRVKSVKINRPNLGFLFFAALASWLIPIIVEFVNWKIYTSENSTSNATFILLIFLAISFGFLFLLTCLQRKSKFSSIYILIAICIASLFSSILYWSHWQSSVESVYKNINSQEFIFETTSDMSKKDYGMVSEVRVLYNNSWKSMRVVWPDGTKNVSIGHRFVGSGSYIKPNTKESGRWNHKNGFLGSINLRNVQEDGFAKSLSGLLAGFRDSSFDRLQNLSSETSGVLAGILLGNKTLYTGTQLEQEFKASGLAHLMAVSGTHLAVICAITNVVLGFLPINRKIKIFLLSMFVVFYLFLSALALSALRSCIMCVAACAAYLFKRRSNSLQALNICAIVLLICNPSIAFSVAFQLSALAVFGIIVFAPLIAVWLNFIFCNKFDKFFQGISVGIAASLTTSPISIVLFQQIPVLSPLSTCIVAPFITIALGSGIIGLVLAPICSFIGNIFLSFSSVCVSVMQILVEYLSNLPFSCIPLDSAAIPIAITFIIIYILIWIFWPQPTKEENFELNEVGAHTGKVSKSRFLAVSSFCLPLLIVLIIGFGGFKSTISLLFNLNSNPEVVMLDVGQGDSMLIRDKKSAILVDVGQHSDLLKAGLARHGVSRLDAIVITHKDADHAGALSSLAGVVSVDNVFIHQDLLNFDGESEVLEAANWVTQGKGASGLCQGNFLEIGRFKLTLLSPSQGGESENEDSLVNLLEYDEDGDGTAESRALLTGDAEAQAIEDVCNNVKNIDFVKVPHHGSKNAFSKEELESLSPKIALISVGEDNSYGHPAQNTVEALQQAGARIYRTDINSDITISFSGKRLSVSLQKK